MLAGIVASVSPAALTNALSSASSVIGSIFPRAAVAICFSGSCEFGLLLLSDSGGRDSRVTCP